MSAELCTDVGRGSPLEVTISGDLTGVTLHVHGEIDLSSIPVLERCLEAAIEEHTGVVVVDLAGVTFLDSSGLQALVNAYRQLADRQRSFVVGNPSPFVERVLMVAGMAVLLERDSEDALLLASGG